MRIEDVLMAVSQLLSATEQGDFEALLEVVGHATGARYVYLQLVPPGPQSLENLSADSEETAVTVWWKEAADEAFSDAHFDQGEPEPRSSERPHARFGSRFEAGLEKEGQTVRAVPILSREDIFFGYIGIVYGDEDSGNGEDLRILNVLGGLLAQHFERDYTSTKLQQSEERWRHVAENHPEPIIITIEGQIAYVNASGARVLGAETPEQLVGYSFFDFISADRYDVLVRHLQAAGRSGVEPLEYEITRLDGEWRIVESLTAPVVYAGRAATQLVLRDLTERRQSERRYRTFVDTISEGIWRIELERSVEADANAALQVQHILGSGIIAEYNHSLVQMLGLKQHDSLLGRQVGRLPAPTRRLVEEFVRAGLTLNSFQASIRLRDGRQQYLVVNATGTVERGKLVRIWGSCIDVTERINLERRIVAHLEQQQQHIGRELHDGVGQFLTSILMLSQLLQQNLPEESEAWVTASKILRFTSEASVQVRNIYRGLAPAQIRTEPLSSILGELAENTDDLPGVRCDFSCEGDVDVADQEHKLHLFRIVQEATNNALKHAQATCIHLSARRAGDQVILEIKDNGVGLRRGKHDPKSLGLDSMHYRAHAVHGKLEVISPAEGGTLIRCVMPRAGGT